MSTKITADNGAEIQVGQLGITVDHPEGIASVWARLSPEQRSALADALDPGRQGWTLADLDRLRTTLANLKAGGQWTREDLPSVMDLVKASVDAMATELGGGADAALDAVVAHLNAHHPKSVHPMDPEMARLRRERDEARNARDTAATRAKQLEREVSKVEGRASEWSIKAQEWRVRAEAAEARATLAEQERENWRITAINRAAPAVSRADIEKAISELRTFPRFLTDELLVLRDEAIDAAWALVSGNEAEQAVDPVEEKAEELMRVLAPETEDCTWRILTEPAREDFRRLARHVLGQEASGDE